MTPFSARNSLGAPSAPDLGHFPARQAVGIPFRAGNDTFFCPEPPRSTFRVGLGAFSCLGGGWYPIPRRKRHLFLRGTASEPLPRRIWVIFLPGRQVVSCSAQQKIPFFLPGTASEHLSRRNATCGTNIWWRAWKSLPKKEICAKVFLFLESAIFEKRNGGKFTLLWSSRMLGADPPVRRPASPHTSRAADLPVRTPAGPQLLFMSGAFGEPPFLYAVALFKDFQDTPE